MQNSDEKLGRPGTTPQPELAERGPRPADARTPGPWMTVYQGGYATLVRSADNVHNVALTALSPLAQADHQRAEADARLIAAAPDLYEALKLALDWMGECNRPPSVGVAMRAALAKARGEA